MVETCWAGIVEVVHKKRPGVCSCIPFELLEVLDIKGIVPSTVEQDLCLVDFEQVTKR